MRCPDCNKFVSFDSDSDPEIELELSDEFNVTGTVRIVNNCSECSQELKDATFDVDVDFADDVHAHWKEHGWKGKGAGPAGHREMDLTDDGGSRSDEYQTTDRRGKPIRNPRYQKHLYGATVTITVECECGETFEREWSDSVQASGMEELV